MFSKMLMALLEAVIGFIVLMWCFMEFSAWWTRKPDPPKRAQTLEEELDFRPLLQPEDFGLTVEE